MLIDVVDDDVALPCGYLWCSYPKVKSSQRCSHACPNTPCSHQRVHTERFAMHALPQQHVIFVTDLSGGVDLIFNGSTLSALGNNFLVGDHSPVIGRPRHSNMCLNVTRGDVQCSTFQDHWLLSPPFAVTHSGLPKPMPSSNSADLFNTSLTPTLLLHMSTPVHFPNTHVHKHTHTLTQLLTRTLAHEHTYSLTITLTMSRRRTHQEHLHEPHTCTLATLRMCILPRTCLREHAHTTNKLTHARKRTFLLSFQSNLHASLHSH